MHEPVVNIINYINNMFKPVINIINIIKLY